MIDINYVQERLDQVKVDSFLPLRSWVRDLITRVRKLENEEVKYKLAIDAYKALVQNQQDRMGAASDAFDEDNFVTGMELLRIDYETEGNLDEEAG